MQRSGGGEILGSTRKLRQDPDAEVSARQLEPIDVGQPHPWRILLRIMHVQVCQVFNLADLCVIGRAHGDELPDIDLQPFKADEMGVSRRHLTLGLEDDRVVAVDSGYNGTWLNGEKMQPEQPYPIRHGDKFRLGMLQLQIEFLMNPFEYTS